jgi:hypothetical protein
VRRVVHGGRGGSRTREATATHRWTEERGRADKMHEGGSPFIGATNWGGKGRLECAAARAGSTWRARSGNGRGLKATLSESFCHLLLSMPRWKGSRQLGGPVEKKRARARARRGRAIWREEAGLAAKLDSAHAAAALRGMLSSPQLQALGQRSGHGGKQLAQRSEAMSRFRRGQVGAAACTGEVAVGATVAPGDGTWHDGGGFAGGRRHTRSREGKIWGKRIPIGGLHRDNGL